MHCVYVPLTQTDLGSSRYLFAGEQLRLSVPGHQERNGDDASLDVRLAANPTAGCYRETVGAPLSDRDHEQGVVLDLDCSLPRVGVPRIGRPDSEPGISRLRVSSLQLAWCAHRRRYDSAERRSVTRGRSGGQPLGPRGARDSRAEHAGCQHNRERDHASMCHEQRVLSASPVVIARSQGLGLVVRGMAGLSLAEVDLGDDVVLEG